MPSLGCMSTGMPRPSSSTETEPSARMRTWIALQWPAIASSMELSTISKTRWWSPRSVTSPMYIAGRRRTASSPSRTLIEEASYAPDFAFGFGPSPGAEAATFDSPLAMRPPRPVLEDHLGQLLEPRLAPQFRDAGVAREGLVLERARGRLHLERELPLAVARDAQPRRRLPEERGDRLLDLGVRQRPGAGELELGEDRAEALHPRPLTGSSA